MRKLLNKKSGFTLIELMIVVAILGILAAIAIPAFVTYVRRAKTVEATENIDKMFSAVSSYYNPGEKQARGITGAQFNHATIATSSDRKTPTDQKQSGDYTTDPGWKAIGFSLETGYYNYQIVNTGGGAGTGHAPLALAYDLQAYGDLDHDTSLSLFEQSTASNAENELYRSRGFYINNETE